MHSVELLAGALNKYEGSIILVSHDRFFISQTANKIWEIVDYKIKEFKGTYQEWVEWNERMAKIEAEKQKLGYQQPKQINTTVAKPDPVPVKTPVKESPAAQGPINKEWQKELQKQQKKLSTLETDLTNAKAVESACETALGNPDNYADRNKFVKLEAEYQSAKSKRSALEKEYEQVFETVLDLESQNK